MTYQISLSKGQLVYLAKLQYKEATIFLIYQLTQAGYMIVYTLFRFNLQEENSGQVYTKLKLSLDGIKKEIDEKARVFGEQYGKLISKRTWDLKEMGKKEVEKLIEEKTEYYKITG
ncbi:MAG: hypothetical protein ACFFD4_30660 [Candidatus Odinarchaeota archaeon]